MKRKERIERARHAALARTAKLTPERRAEIARNAAQTRWRLYRDDRLIDQMMDGQVSDGPGKEEN